MTLDINTLKKGLVESRVWKSVVRHGYPDTETNRALAIMSNLFLHLHPVKGGIGDFRCDFFSIRNRGKVAHAPEQSVGDTGRPPMSLLWIGRSLT